MARAVCPLITSNDDLGRRHASASRAITAAFALPSSGGGVTANGIRGGTATAGSSGGAVRLRFASAPDRVDVDSSGGGVEVTLPRDGGPYRVDASSSGGNEVVQVPTDPTSTRVVTAHSSGGSVRVVLADEG